jgi:hypothetical protein
MLKQLRYGWVVLLLILNSAWVGAQPGGRCSGYCTYLPMVTKAPPLVVTETAFINRRSFYAVQGTIQNFGDTVLYDPVIEVRLYDSNLQLVKVITGTALLSASMPLQVTPFDFRVGDPSLPWIAKEEARVISWRTPTSVETYYPLTIRKLGSQPYEHGVRLDVEIRNDWPHSVDQIDLAIWFIPDSTALGTTSYRQSLAPGEAMILTFGVPDRDTHFAAQGMAIP